MVPKNRTAFSYFTLDILLPLGGCLLIWLLNKTASNQDVSELTSMIVLPIVLCMIRVVASNAVLEHKKINALPNYKRILFQLFLALSLIALMLFESLSAVLAMEKDIPGIVWAVCVSFYLAYLVFMFLSEKSCNYNPQSVSAM